MAKITKKVDRNIPVSLRSQEFLDTDAVEGDVLMVQDSLGKYASQATIRAVGGSLKVRFNVYQTVYPRRQNDSLHAEYALNLASGQEYKVAGGSTGDFIVETNTTREVNRRFPIKDIELVTVSGNWDLFVS
jgi:hypothetical protein